MMGKIDLDCLPISTFSKEDIFYMVIRILVKIKPDISNFQGFANLTLKKCRF